MSLLKLLPKVLLLLVFFSCADSVNGKDTSIKGKVIGVSDGDTITILWDGKPLKIRFAHVDCPELKRSQPFGRAAKKFTSDACYAQIVTIENEGKYDRYKRLIGVVINEKGENVNKELVRAGLAWHFKKYSTDESYDVLESAARAQKLGLWADANPTPPWIWRKMKKEKRRTGR